MKQFFKFVFASMLGFILAGVVLLIVVIGIIAGLVDGNSEKTVEVTPNSVLQIKLNYPIAERTPNNPLAALGFLGVEGEKTMGLNDILANIKKAKRDTNIKGIFLDESILLTGEATTEEIRNALIDFKKSGKFIVAYSEIYTQGFYYLASVADKVYINPKGLFDFKGFNSKITFLKGTLDKLGIEAQIIKVGTYKSAVEPFFLTKMSDANRLQVNSYLGSLYDHFLNGISQSRKISKDSLFAIANELKIRGPEDALKYKLVDGLKYKDEILDDLKKRAGVDASDDLKAVELRDYGTSESAKEDKKETSKNNIAIIYASGDIVGGEGDDNTIGSERISKA
ncbi:MAG: S49 family peptidase, partial [Mucilaginibacter sp.]